MGTFYFSLGRQVCKEKKSGDVRSPHKILVFLLMVLICHIFVLIVYLNLHYGLVWASGLSREGFECSKDPFPIKIQYKYHSVRVILYMGIQQGCSAKALLIFLLFFLVNKVIHNWECCDFHFILSRRIKCSNMLVLISH